MSIFPQNDRNHYFPYHRGEKYPPKMTINFRQLKVDSCRKYLRHYKVNVRPNCSTDEFRVAVARHFDQALKVNEAEILNNFCKRIAPRSVDNDTSETKRQKQDSSSRRRTVKRASVRNSKVRDNSKEGAVSKKKRRGERKNVSVVKTVDSDEDTGKRTTGGEGGDEAVYCICQGRSYGKMIACENEDCEMKWFHFACVNLTPSTKPTGKWYCPDCSKNRSRAKEDNQASKSYKAMIESALKKLAKKKKGKAEGTFKEICAMIEYHHWRNLNWKSESDIRKTPVWRSSVRKILFANDRFCRRQFNPNVFGLSK